MVTCCRCCAWGIVLILAAVPVRAEQTTLDQAFVQAYQNNPSLEAERAKLRAIDEAISQAQSHWRPQATVSGNVGKTYQNIPAQKRSGKVNFAETNRGYGVQVAQPIFRGFRTLSETKVAEKKVMAARSQLHAVEQKLLLDVASAFLDIIRDEKILTYTKENKSVLQQKLKEVSVRAKVGDLTRTDVHQSESRLARSEITLLQTKNQLAADRAAYVRVVGDIPGTLQKPKVAPNAYQSLDDLRKAAEKNNPNVVAALYSYDQSEAEVDLNKGALLPELAVVANASRNWAQSNSIPGEENSSQIMLQLKVPLYQSGAEYSAIRAASQTSVQRRMELEAARRSARELAENAWQALQTAEEAIKADRSGVDAAKRALEGVRVQSKVGTRTTLEVLNAEQELLDAKTELAKAEHDRDLALLQLRSATGDLTADALKLPLEPYDPSRHYEETRGKWIGFGSADADVYRHDDDPERQAE
jgi:outer membrane protein